MRETIFQFIYRHTENLTPDIVHEFTLDQILEGEEFQVYSLISGRYGRICKRQYTGIKDKNGVKIFEGDTLKWVAYGTPDDECKQLYDTRLLTVEWLGCGFYIPYEDDSHRFYEIIGNIHQEATE